MPAYFLDSSALVKRYRKEDGTELILNLLSGSNHIVISRLAEVEVTAALVRRGKTTGIAKSTIDSVLSILKMEVDGSFDVIELSPAILASAVTLTRIHALRGADAVQLACAMIARNQSAPLDVCLVSADLELNAAAVAEGFPILNPAQ